ncbi:Transferase [Trema orientale]|uniref:Transferase n=1 Tax=Trema orientale TaxID=63057 RepID=A0A2P5E754_TREOI|nr:Transferase [Trema orientale]
MVMKAVEECSISPAGPPPSSSHIQPLTSLATTDHHLSCSNKASTEEEPVTLDLSPYVLTCAYLWVCVLKVQQQAGCLFTSNNNNNNNNNSSKHAFKDPSYLGFVAGGLTRIEHPIPATYLGNCVGFGRAMAVRGELLGDEGVLVAVKAIRSTVKRLDREIFSGAEKWISEWEELIGPDIHVMVSGSPKVDLYEMDFGWGRPKKIEEMEIDSTKAISLSESRDVKGGMEIGLVLPKPEMEAFTALFKEGLKAM